GLMAAGEVGHPAVARGVGFLIATQSQKGLWDEQRYTATCFPRVFYLRYHGYPRFFPLWALARYRNLKNANSRSMRYGMCRVIPRAVNLNDELTSACAVARGRRSFSRSTLGCGCTCDPLQPAL